MSTTSRQPTFVFVHGMIGFQLIGVWDLKVAFFRGVPNAYRQLGLTAVFPRVSNLASIERRAGDLANFIESENLDRVVLVGASMGGLDARYYTPPALIARDVFAPLCRSEHPIGAVRLLRRFSRGVCQDAFWCQPPLPIWQHH